MSSTTTAHANAYHFSESELESAAEYMLSLDRDSQMRRLFQLVVDTGQRGAGVIALAQDKDLSPNEAAEVLGISRPHLLTFIRGGALKVHYVGTHQRITYADFMDFKSRYEDAGKDVAEALAGRGEASQQIELTDEEMAELDSL